MKAKSHTLKILGMACLAMALVVFTASGCTDDDAPPTGQNFEPVGDTGGDDEMDTGDDAGTDTESPTDDVADDPDTTVDPCQDVECDEGHSCEEGQCVPDGGGFSCGDPLWVDLDDPGIATLSGNMQDAPGLMETSCGQGEDLSQMVFAFSVNTATRLTAHVSSVEFPGPVNKELRIGECDNPTAVEWCSINQQNWIAEPDTDYFLVVEAAASDIIGDFEVDLNVEPLVCEPGARSCREGDLFRCAGGDEEVEHPCVAGCENGECLGDSCANPLVWSQSMEFTAEMASFHDHMDFSNSPGCSSSGTEGPGTDGQDIVVSVPGVTAGQTIQATSPGGHYRIGILDTCNQTAPECLVGNSTGGGLEWEAEHDGEYFVVFNRMTTANEDAQFSVDVVD